jgi:hypothetical protein
MAADKKRGGGAVRKSSKVGPDYAEGRYEVPWNCDLDTTYGNKTSKAIHSPAESTFEPPVGIHGGYDKLWNGGK